LEDAIITFWGWHDHILRMTGSHFEDDRITFWGWQDHILRMTGSHFEDGRITFWGWQDHILRPFWGCRRHIWMLPLSPLDSVFIILEAIRIKLWGCPHHIWSYPLTRGCCPRHIGDYPITCGNCPHHIWRLQSWHLKATLIVSGGGRPRHISWLPAHIWRLPSSYFKATLITFKACTQHICRKFSIHLEAAFITFGECLVIFRDWPYYIWLKSHHNWRLPISHLEHNWRNVHPRFVPW
jgi:hypothetical protein